jgi:hypothetical protein
MLGLDVTTSNAREAENIAPATIRRRQNGDSRIAVDGTPDRRLLPPVRTKGWGSEYRGSGSRRTLAATQREPWFGRWSAKPLNPFDDEASAEDLVEAPSARKVSAQTSPPCQSS